MEQSIVRHDWQADTDAANQACVRQCCSLSRCHCIRLTGWTVARTVGSGVLAASDRYSMFQVVAASCELRCATERAQSCRGMTFSGLKQQRVFTEPHGSRLCCSAAPPLAAKCLYSNSSLSDSSSWHSTPSQSSDCVYLECAVLQLSLVPVAPKSRLLHHLPCLFAGLPVRLSP